jgi:hypothetical protein
MSKRKISVFTISAFFLLSLGSMANARVITVPANGYQQQDSEEAYPDNNNGQYVDYNNGYQQTNDQQVYYGNNNNGYYSRNNGGYNNGRNSRYNNGYGRVNRRVVIIEDRNNCPPPRRVIRRNSSPGIEIRLNIPLPGPIFRRHR